MKALTPRKLSVWLLLAGALLLIAPQAVRACSVCFGDPNSDMARGAVRGVLFMIAVTAGVLGGIASIAGVWIVRARRIARNADSASANPNDDHVEHNLL